MISDRTFDFDNLLILGRPINTDTYLSNTQFIRVPTDTIIDSVRHKNYAAHGQNITRSEDRLL